MKAISCFVAVCVCVHRPCAELYWDLNDPTNSIVVAALELVYGVLPPTLALAEHGSVHCASHAGAAIVCHAILMQ